MKKMFLFYVLCIVFVLAQTGIAAIVSKESWEKESCPTSENINDVSTVDANNAWAVGDNGTVLRRTTAGWAAISGINSNYNLNGVHVLKSNTAYVWIVGVNKSTGYGVLVKTITGNNTTPSWTEVTIAQALPTTFMAVKFNDELILGF